MPYANSFLRSLLTLDPALLAALVAYGFWHIARGTRVERILVAIMVGLIIGCIYKFWVEIMMASWR